MNFFKTYYPSETLKDMVELYWRSKCELHDSLVQDMNTPTMQVLTFNMSGWHEEIMFEQGSLTMDKNCYLIGQPLSKRISISNPLGIDILGVKFTPLGIYMLTGIDMQHLSDRIMDAADIWNQEILFLHEALLDQKTTQAQLLLIETFLKRRRKMMHGEDRLCKLNQALFQMKKNKVFSVSQLRDECFVSKKTFERYFLNYVGVTPKQYTNIYRFNDVLNYMNTAPVEPDWQYIIFRFGYYDQSHLIRDFRRYAHMTPGEYYAHLVNTELTGSESSLLQHI